jgi:transcriptional regulator with XRE-family HTH domain
MRNIRSVTPVDAYVGGKVRGYRMLNGMSQEQLGKMLGVTFQQIQKYENGKNRITGSRLQQIATIFELSITDLLPPQVLKGKRKKTIITTNFDRMITMTDGIKLINSFVAIKNDTLRDAIVQLARRLEDA